MNFEIFFLVDRFLVDLNFIRENVSLKKEKRFKNQTNKVVCWFIEEKPY